MMLATLTICSFVFAVIALVVSIQAIIEVKAMKNTTHNFTMVDTAGKNIKDQIFDALSPEAREEMENQVKAEYKGII